MPRAAAWVVALVALTLLAALVEVSFQEAGRPPIQGIHTSTVDGAVVVNYVLPAGTAWDSGIRPGDHIVQANGRAAREMSDEELNKATSLTLARQSGVVSFPENLPDTPAKHLAFLVIAAGFALVGGLVVT